MEFGDIYENFFNEIPVFPPLNELFSTTLDQADLAFFPDQCPTFTDLISDVLSPYGNEMIQNSPSDQVVNEPFPYSEQKNDHLENSSDIACSDINCRNQITPCNDMHLDFTQRSSELSPSYKCDISQESLLEMKAKDLNKLLKNLPEEEVKALKRKRRQLKNRTYAKDCRKKKVRRSTSQEEEISQLRMELQAKSLEVEQLKEENQRLKLIFYPNI